METPQRGSPRRKLLVPSIGSTTQQRSLAAPPLSSPRKPSVGKASANPERINASTSRSAMLTKYCGHFVSRVNAVLLAKYLPASAPASRITAVAVVRRASIVMAGQPLGAGRATSSMPQAVSDSAPSGNFCVVAIFAEAHLWRAIRHEDKGVFPNEYCRDTPLRRSDPGGADQPGAPHGAGN